MAQICVINLVATSSQRLHSCAIMHAAQPHCKQDECEIVVSLQVRLASLVVKRSTAIQYVDSDDKYIHTASSVATPPP